MNLKTLQNFLKENNLTGAFYPLGNMFINEDILPEENQILRLTGFSGSYALLFVTPKKAYLFVDGRYELQAKKEVNLKETTVVKLSEISFPGWLKKNFAAKPTRILYNPWLLSCQTLNELQTLLPQATFCPESTPSPLLSEKKAKVFAHAKKFAGASVKEKLSLLTRFIQKQQLDAYLITDASNVSWLLNLRSDALPYTPIFRACALVKANGTYKIFADNTDCKTALPLSELTTAVSTCGTLGADFGTCPAYILSFSKKIINCKDPLTALKAHKNKTELKGAVAAHIRDGIALSKFLCWLSKNYTNKTETDIANKLLSFRREEENFYSESFAAIAGYGTNAAIIHYHAKKDTAATLKPGSVLLLDSGGQYFDGTTDVTRTIALGTPTPEMVLKNTLVLKAHIALASAVFPAGTTGAALDLIARQPLLKKGFDFAHGTGHGVGCFSNVHEGPARISSAACASYPLAPAMITSIEPGYYEENAFGIRIENLYYVKENARKGFLNFAVLTLAPLDKTLINKYLLSEDELSWLNAYHKEVFKKLKKYMTKQELAWLKDACAPL